MKNNTEIYSNINDKKRIYKIDNANSIKINDIKGKELDIKEFIIKTIMINPEYDEDGKIIKEYEEKLITILVDKEDKTYVTASKFFAHQLQEYIDYFGIDSIKNDGFKIKIIEKSVSNSKNKALGFELVE